MKEKFLALLNKAWKFLRPKCWYIFLLIISTAYVLHYRFEIYELKEINACNLIFLLWLLLLALPLFSEMEFLGIKVKKEVEKEVEKATEEVKETLQNIQSQISQMQVNNSVANHFSFGNTALPSGGKLEELSQIIRELQKASKQAESDYSENQNNTPERSPKEFSQHPQDPVAFLAKVRCEIEVAVRQLCEKLGYSNVSQFWKMLGFLNRAELLTGMTCDLISQVRKIANRGVHGEIISTEYITFVETAYPQIMHQLDAASKQLTYIECPRCHFTGYTTHENLCPQCDYLNED